MMRFLSIGLVLAIAGVAPGFGEEVVHFQNGQAMRVEKTRREGRWLFLELASDGEMAVLLRQISKVEEAEPLAGGPGSSPANVVSAGGAGSRAARRGAAGRGYNPTRAGQEPAVGAAAQGTAAQQTPTPTATPVVVPGQDLVPRTPRRGGRQNQNRPPRQ